MAGKCLCSRVAESFGDLFVDGICEINPDDAQLARHTFAHASVTCDFFEREWRLWATSPDVLFVLACTPCNPVADSGQQRGVASDDIDISVSAIPEIVRHFKVPFFCGEQHHQLARLHGGAVLQLFDANLAAVDMLRTPLVRDAPLGVELVSDLFHAERRQRIGLHYERAGMQALIGPCPEMTAPSCSPMVLADVLDPPELVPEHLYLDGVWSPCRVQFPLRRDYPTVCGTLTVGGPDHRLFVGARVRLVDVVDSPLYVLFRWRARTSITLFLDDRRAPGWVYDVHPRRLVQEAFDVEVLHIDGVGHTMTSFGVPPIGPCKQAIRVGDRVRILTTAEMFRLGGDAEALDLYRASNPDISDFALRSKPGKSLQRNLALALVARLRRRIRAYVDVLHGGQAVADAPASLLAPFLSYVGSADAFVVFVSMAESAPRFLVGDNFMSLPAIPLDGPASHRSVLQNVARLSRSFENSLGFVPESFLAGSVDAFGNERFVVSCPLGNADTGAVHGAGAQWATISQLADTPVYEFAALAYGSTLTMLDHAQCHGCD